MSLSNKSIAVITGAGSGIGRALALRLAEEGVAGLAVSDVDEAGLAETAALIEKTGTDFLTSVVDVSKREDVRRFADETLEKFGSATHLFNNAGVGMVGQTEELSIEDIEWLMGINFWGTIYGTKIFLPIFREQDFGHIINISSVFGFIGMPGQSAYCASKFAVRGFTETLSLELAGSNIHVSCVHPGGIQTNIAKQARKGEKATEADKKMASSLFDKLTPTTPAEAADIIVKGVKAKSPRILIGPDAGRISLIYRLFPKKYFTVMNRMSGGMLSKFK